MTIRNLFEAKTPDLRGSLAVARCAVEMGRTTTIQTNKYIFIVTDGEILHVTSKGLRAEQQV